MSTSVFIIEDNPHLRETMLFSIGRLPGLGVCGAAASGEEALETLAGITPDLVLVDGSLPGMSGMEFVREMTTRAPAIPCLFFSGTKESFAVKGALEAGARGYVVKGGKMQELIDAVATVVGGGCYVSPSVGWGKPPEAAAQEC